MEWQTTGALAIVVAVAAVLTRWKLRSLQKDLNTPCAGSCSCSMPPPEPENLSRKTTIALEKTPPASYL